MKSLLFALLMLVGISAVAKGPDNTPPVAPQITILKVSTMATVEVRLTNVSKQPIRIFDESNSWGAMDWRVLRIRNGKVEAFYQSPYQGFTKNNPTSFELAPGAHRDLKIDINGGNWCGFGRCSWYYEKGLGGQKITFAKGDQIVVIYEAPISEESQKIHVFSGVVAATYTVQ